MVVGIVVERPRHQGVHCELLSRPGCGVQAVCCTRRANKAARSAPLGVCHIDTTTVVQRRGRMAPSDGLT